MIREITTKDAPIDLSRIVCTVNAEPIFDKPAGSLICLHLSWQRQFDATGEAYYLSRFKIVDHLPPLRIITETGSQLVDPYKRECWFAIKDSVEVKE